ncbi:hypothetical protein [Flavobacterium sp. UBA7682]|nr:hypothetical protein [Flavobacterium sp. UBA7682]
MNNYWTIIAVTIGYLYSRKYGREAVEKINKFYAEKENQNKKS